MSITKTIGFLVIFLAVFILFFIFDSLQKIVNQCNQGLLPSDLCNQLERISIPSLTFILLIATTLLVVFSTTYQILTKAKSSGESVW